MSILSFFYFYFLGDSEFSETLDKCLECMHTKEVCVIPINNDDTDQQLDISSKSDLQCEIELLSFFKVEQFIGSGLLYYQLFCGVNNDVFLLL